MAKICRFCGYTLSDTDHVCPQCKHEVVDACPVCGTKLYDNEAFCPGCGTPVVVKCAGCGKEVYSGEKFCPYCGTKNEVFPTSFPPITLGMNQFGTNQFGSTFGGFGSTCGGLGFGSPYGGFGLNTPYGGFGLNNSFGFNSPVMLPPISLDGTQLPAEPAKAEAIERTRPQPNTPAPAPEKKHHEVKAAEPAEETTEETKKSKLGIVGFIFAILSFIPLFWFISIPCCAVAIKRNNGYKKLAIAGLVIALIWILAWAGLIIYMYAFNGVDTIQNFLNNDILKPLGIKATLDLHF